MIHIEHKGFVVNLVDCNAALSLDPENEMEEVIVELLHHISHTPPPTIPFEVIGNDDPANVGMLWNNLGHLWSTFSWSPDRAEYTGYVMDEVIFIPHFLEDIHSPMRIADTASHAAVDLDFRTGSCLCNGIGTAAFIEKLSILGEMWRIQALKDIELIESGKLTWDDIERMENSLYSDVRVLM